MMMPKCSLVAVLLVLLTVSARAAEKPAEKKPEQQPLAPLVEQYLLKGELAKGDAALLARLKEQPDDDQARFGLGMLRFLRAIEHLVQALHWHGLRDFSGVAGGQIPFLRLPVPPNAKPERLSYAQSRAVMQHFIDDLHAAKTVLTAVKSDAVKLPLHVGLIRLDLDGDGVATEDERFWKIYLRYNNTAQAVPADAEAFWITFDAGDVHWLRGYCDLLMAMAEFILAHDGTELFEATAHLFFPDVVSPHDFLAKRRVWDVGGVDVIDAIALIHLIRMPVVEPKRLTATLAHLEQMVECSQESWRDILAETDDDHEWIPNPHQTGVIPGVRVTDEMVVSWKAFLAETKELLAGRRLVPFWRSIDERGINLRRVFTEPRPFDLVLWVQGTAATPYLEKGTLTRPEVWDRLTRVFGGEFIGFAFWFN